MTRILLAMYPGLARILALVAMLVAAGLAGAYLMAERIASDEQAANRNAYLDSP